MLGIIMQLEISTIDTSSNNNHLSSHEKQIIEKKKKKKENTKIWGTRPKLIC